MKSVSFFEGAFVALLLACIASMSFAILTSIFPHVFALRWLITLLATIYVTYLLVRSGEKVGRITVAICWMIACIVLMLIHPPIVTHVVMLAGLIWIVRCLSCYASIVCALMDLALVGIAVLLASWAAWETNSLFLSVWCFFLVQAIFIRIPRSLELRAHDLEADAGDQQRFAQSLSIAELAVRKLTTNP
jgi:hypothetical protein